MGRIAGIRPRRDIATKTRRATRSSVAGGAAIGKPGTDGEIGADISNAVARERAETVCAREFALEELAASSD